MNSVRISWSPKRSVFFKVPGLDINRTTKPN